ncbi:MAG: FkbM family methyltransferase [Gammaproteobacteria bacterium]|nr:FkbM family methyltransferase [Gammaproteobacteria bacterium]
MSVWRRSGPAGFVQRLAHARGLHAQFGQDRFLDRQVFRGLREGVFVEAGAYDGVTGSNTVFLERVRGWHGLLVEPSPQLAAQARRNRNAPVHEVALAADDGRAAFIEVSAGYRMMSGLAHDYPEARLREVRANHQHRERRIEVPTRTLAALLDEAGIERLDLVSLDIEGGELAVLRSFPFARIRVEVWCIENHPPSPLLASLMSAHGYRHRATLGVDEIYVLDTAAVGHGC